MIIMSKQPLLSDFKTIAETHHLKFIAEKPLEGSLLAIINLDKQFLTVVSRDIFCKKHGFTWTEDVLQAGTPSTEDEKKALQQANSCWKALLETDYGWGVTHLQEIKQGDYVGLYEGSFIDQKLTSLDPRFNSSKYQKTLSDETYLLGFTPTGASWQSGLITAKDFRGFGGFLQHLPNEDEVKAYYFSTEFKDKFSVENLSRVNLGNRVFFKAKMNLPPLSQLGFSYISYWCGRTESPVLFNQRTGLSIPTSVYQHLRYFIRFVDTQSGEEEYQNCSIQQLQNLDRGRQYGTLGRLIYRPKDLQAIRDAKSGKIKPKTLYSRILIEDLTAQDFMTVANNYFIGNNPDDMQSPEHIQTVIYFYQRAKQLFLQKNSATEAARCQKRIEFYQRLPQSSAPNQQDQEAKQLLEKYTLKADKTPVDRNLAFRRAAAVGHLADLTQLLLLGAQMNDQGTGSRKTALHHAVINNHFPVVLFLMAHQANPSLKDRDGRMAFDYVKAGSSLYQKIKESVRTDPSVASSLKTPFSFT
jgi:Ankyrin repeats (many copies)